MRVCPVPGCPRLVKVGAYRGLCDEHRKARDKARGSRQQRGYDSAHVAARAEIQRRIDSGETVTCWRCNIRLTGRAWHLDHQSNRKGYRGPACIPCNLELAGKASQALKG